MSWNSIAVCEHVFVDIRLYFSYVKDKEATDISAWWFKLYARMLLKINGVMCVQESLIVSVSNGP